VKRLRSVCLLLGDVILNARFFYVALLLALSAQCYAAQLSSVYVDCNNDLPGPPPTISGQVGDTLYVYAYGSCANYRQSQGYSNVATSNPSFGSTLNNEIAEITLTTAGTGLVYVYNSLSSTRGKSFFLQVTSPPMVTLTGSVNGTSGVDLLFFIRYSGNLNISDESVNGPFSKGLPIGSDMRAGVISFEYICDSISAISVQNNISRNIYCRYQQPVFYAGFARFKSGGYSTRAAISTVATTEEPVFPDHPITYTASCTSSDGGMSVSGSESSIDWNAQVDVPLAFTPGKTYTCTGNASAAGISTQPYAYGPLIPAPTPPAPPQPIPTLSEWAQIMMMLAMIATAGFYGWRMKQR